MSKALETGKSLAALVLAKLPESLRAEAEKAFNAPEATDALIELGARGLAQSDYSRLMDEIRDKEAAVLENHRQLEDWWKANEPKLSAYEQEIARLKGTTPPAVPTTPTTPTGPSGLSKEDLDKVLEERDRGYAGVLAFTTTLAAKHLKDFNEVLDVAPLVEFANKHRVSLDQAYRTAYGEKIAAKAKAEEDARIAKLVDERFADRMKNAGQPFPLKNGGESVLDLIEAKADLSKHSIDSAVAEYERLQGTRG